MMVPQRQILVVEDNEINRMILREILSAEYTVLEAENGREALSVLERHKGEVALILLDIVMPVMDGYTFLSIAKANPVFASIPVIVTTQSDSESDEVAALSHGAADFVAKPYKPQIILHRVASIIHLRETSAMINQFQYDRLTGLYSKEFFYQRVRDILLQHPERKYDIVCSDVENFKLINDIFGVSAGDSLLRGVADLYTKLVGDHGICSHFNADRFVCLLEHRCAYEDDFFVQAGAELAELPQAKSIVIKWGVYEVRDKTISVEQMCDRAFLAARSIKGQYGKRFALYDDQLRSKLLREQAITDGMESALAEEQFVIYLQPKYRIRDGRLAGAEALVRWNHPQWGFLSPGEFIPLFEKNGFIARLDQFVWDKACAVLHGWRDRGLPLIPVSVNVSRADIYQVDLPEILTAMVQKYELPPSCLHLEITESAYTENPDQIINTVGQLRDQGFVIEMDDFGSGYSSLNMLNQLPLDILKLDMKFIQSETAKPADQGILRFIMGLARWMNLSVVAEGVETKGQLDRLREIGCDYVQGYYFAKPMPCGDFEALMKEHAETAAPEEQAQIPEGLQAPILLVADEDAQYRAQVRETFFDRYQVLETADGGSTAASIMSHERQVAAVILSLTLPVSEGITVLDVLRREKSVWGIPVIATGPADQGLEETAWELGAADYACKPHSQKNLRHRVMRALEAVSSRERERVLQEEAYRDYLTGLLNRRGIQAAAQTLRKSDAPLALYLFDLDNMKQINDTYGHKQGDRMLQKFAELLNAQTRGADLLSRYGGDEFVVLMKGMESEEAALRKGQEICMAFQEICRQEEMATACSVGIVVCPHADFPVTELIVYADEALYRAKNENKGGCCLWKGSTT